MMSKHIVTAFDDDLTAEQVPDGEPQDSVTVMIRDGDYVESETVDPRWFRLFEMAPDRPGTYDVYATRGMEYSLDVECMPLLLVI